jgi:hypothetical protein
MVAEDKQIGWFITKVHDASDSERVGYGQSIDTARKTMTSYEMMFGRTLFVETGLSLQDIPYDKRVKWRSFSDDGDPAYDGVVHIDWLYPTDESENDTQDDDLAYNLDRFCMEDWGAVHVAYNIGDIKRCRPDLADYIDRHSPCQYAKAYTEIYG